MSLAVVYLARGIGGGLQSAESFFAAYDVHPGGMAHELIVLAKGWESEPGRDTLNEAVRSHGARIMDLPDDGLDFGAYRRACDLIDHDWVCFLNTSSRVQADDWLTTLMKAAQAPGVGIAGATGSWGTLLPSYRFIPGVTGDLIANKGFAAAAIRAVYMSTIGVPSEQFRGARHFAGFPNPHIRSNAFVMRRKLFCEFATRSAVPVSKADTHRLESGRRGLTRFIQTRGLEPVVVGRDQRAYTVPDWKDSQTFRYPGQKNLLVSDNQTRAYDRAPAWSRRIMERSAWGRTMTEWTT